MIAEVVGKQTGFFTANQRESKVFNLSSLSLTQGHVEAVLYASRRVSRLMRFDEPRDLADLGNLEIDADFGDKICIHPSRHRFGRTRVGRWLRHLFLLPLSLQTNKPGKRNRGYIPGEWKPLLSKELIAALALSAPKKGLCPRALYAPRRRVLLGRRGKGFERWQTSKPSEQRLPP